MALKLGRTAAFHFLTQVVVSLSGFAATFVIARFLGPTPLGYYAKATAVLFLVGVPIIAVHTAIIKRMSEGSDREAYFGGGIVLVAAVLLVLLLAVFVVRSQFESYVGVPIAGEFMLLLVGTGAFRLLQAVLSGEKQVARAGLIQSFERVLRTLLQVGFIVLGYSISGLLLGHGIALLTAGVLGLFLSQSWPETPKRKHIESIVEYSRFSWLARLKGRAFSWTDTAVLGFLVTSSLIGIYEVAWTLSATLILISKSVQQTLFPEFSELSTEDDYDQIHHLLNEGMVFTAIFCLPGLVGAALIGPRILGIYGGAFRAGATVLVILVFAQLASAFGEQFTFAINAIDRPDVAFKISGAFILVNVILNVLLIWEFGWVGAAAATALSSTGLVIAGFVVISRLIGRPTLPVTEFAAQVIAALGMGGALYMARSAVPAGHYWTVLLVLGAAALYTVLLVALSTRVRSKALALARSVSA